MACARATEAAVGLSRDAGTPALGCVVAAEPGLRAAPPPEDDDDLRGGVVALLASLPPLLLPGTERAPQGFLLACADLLAAAPAGLPDADPAAAATLLS